MRTWTKGAALARRALRSRWAPTWAVAALLLLGTLIQASPATDYARGWVRRYLASHDLTIGGDVVPSADDTYDLGSSSAAYAQVHAEDVLVGDDVNLGANDGLLVFGAADDASVSRAGAAGILQVGDGGANANGYLVASRLVLDAPSTSGIALVRDGNNLEVKEGDCSAYVNVMAKAFLSKDSDWNLVNNDGLDLASDNDLQWSSTTSVYGDPDVSIASVGSGLVAIGNGDGSGKGGLQLEEVSDYAAPSANTARIYVRDNGAGKTQLVVVFPTGAVQVIATEP